MARFLFFLLYTSATWLPLVTGTCHDTTLDCQITYGPWSTCDPCSRQQSRHLNVTTPAHHNGQPCPTNLEEHQECVPSEECPAMTTCPGQFDCGNHRCINQELACNGDDDCGNGNDERACSPTQAFPKAINDCLNLPTVPYLDQIGSGIDIVSGKLLGRVVDNQRFNGLCRKAYDGDAKLIYRLPYNVDNFHFQVTMSDDLKVESYDSMASLTKSLNQSQDTSISGGLSFSIDSFGFDSSVAYTSSKTYQQLQNSASQQQSLVFRLNSRVELAQFILNDDDVILDNFFLSSVRKLPLQYNPKAYFDFFKQYGTHYLHSGVLGGIYEHYYVYDTNTVSKLDQSADTLSNCLKLNMKASFLKFGANVDSSTCSSKSNQDVATKSVVQVALNKVVNIKGGTAQVAGRLAAEDISINATDDSSKFGAWVSSVQQNPALISKDMRSICELVYLSNTTNGTEKYSVCMLSMQAFLAGYSRTNCQKCANGGIAININQQCQCACASGFGGVSCDFKYPPAGQPYRAVSAGPTPVTDFAFVASPPVGPSMIKLLATGNPPRTSNPPSLISTPVGTNDEIMKIKDNSLFVLTSAQGMYANVNGQAQGGYSIRELDEFLGDVSNTPINFANINCLMSVCNIWDFDVDGLGNYALSVQSFNMSTGTRRTDIYTIDKDGNVLLHVPTPCNDTDQAANVKVYITLTCDNSLAVTCPGAPGTLRLFSNVGKPLQITQLPGLDELNSVQFFNDNLWVHSKSRQVAAYDFDSWTQVYNYTGSTFGDPLDFTQIFVDFTGNIIAGQSHNSDPTFGRQNEKFLILQGTQDQQVLASALLDNWNKCQSIAALNGKLYTRCSFATDDSQAKIFAFDYLK